MGLTEEQADVGIAGEQRERPRAAGARVSERKTPKRFWAVALPLLAVSVSLEITVRTLGWFETYPWVDNPMHLLWGANVFWICLWLFRCRPSVGLLLVLVWQAIWETGEIIGDWLIPQPEYMLDGIWPDGVKDTVMDLLGALMLWGVYWMQKIPLPLPKRAKPHDHF